MSEPLLDVRGLTRRFSGLVAVDDVSFTVDHGTIAALIGPNGAGKTTCFSMIAGALHPTRGSIWFSGTNITGLAPENICRAGLARTFQVVRPLADMSVVENAIVGALCWTNNVEAAREHALLCLDRVGLRSKSDWHTDALTLPDRKMLEVARVLATKPRMLLLDEALAGLRPAESTRIVEVLRDLAAGGLTIMLVEHVMRVVMALASKVIVLHHGQKIAEGRPEEIAADPAVIQSYLGSKRAHA